MEKEIIDNETWEDVLGDYDPNEVIKRIRENANCIKERPKHYDTNTLVPICYKYDKNKKCVFLDVCDDDECDLTNFCFDPICCVTEVNLHNLDEAIETASQLFDRYGHFCCSFQQINDFIRKSFERYYNN